MKRKHKAIVPEGMGVVRQGSQLVSMQPSLFAPPANQMMNAEQVQAVLDRPPPTDEGLGYKRVQFHAGSSYKDCSTVIIIPSRDPFFHHRVVQSWQNLMAPMNQKRAMIFCIGDEVGKAYETMIENILKDPELSKWKYVMTLESDNIQPPDAHIRLLETIEAHKFDAVSGIYWTKGEFNMPMAYGDPEEYRRTGVLDFKPRDVRAALNNGHVMPVNGIAMGCSLYRMDIFKDVPKPWFETVADIVPGKGPMAFTQDLWFCKRAVERGKTFAVDLRVRVGHLDFASGTVY